MPALLAAAPLAPCHLFMHPSSNFSLIPPTAPHGSSPHGSFPSPIMESQAQSPLFWDSPFSHEVITGLIASRRTSTAASWPTAPERTPAPFWLAFYMVQGPISCPANQMEVAPPPNLKHVSHFSISFHPRVMMDSFLPSISFLVDL